MFFSSYISHALCLQLNMNEWNKEGRKEGGEKEGLMLAFITMNAIKSQNKIHLCHILIKQCLGQKSSLSSLLLKPN